MNHRKMLIIEDDRATRDALQGLFISRGWEVAMVTAQAEGLALLEDYDPDWIVVAWDQLEGTGERFMLHVRAKPRRPRVALLTEPMDSAGWALASRLKADVRFRKPIAPEDVFLACEPGWKRDATLVG
jgi:DNA-binding response OmpR family regulator